MTETIKLEPGQLCHSVRMTHVDGTHVYPVAMTNSKTRRVAFVVAKPGTNSHHRSAAIEVTDETELARLILDQRMKVRCRAVDGSHDAQYSPDGRKIVRVERN